MRPDGAADESLHGNCGLVTLSALLGVDYQEVKEEFQKLFPRRKGWDGSTSIYERVKFMHHYGAKVCFQGHPKRTVKNVVPLLDPKSRYMLRTGGHAMACIEGQLIDQSGTFSPQDPLRANKRVSHIHRVELP